MFKVNKRDTSAINTCKQISLLCFLELIFLIMSTLFCVLTKLVISIFLLIVSLGLISSSTFISIIFGIILDVIALILLFTDPDDVIRWISRKLN